MAPGMGTGVGARNSPFLASKTEAILHLFPLLASGTWGGAVRRIKDAYTSRSAPQDTLAILGPA
jgi:hypothetical protein